MFISCNMRRCKTILILIVCLLTACRHEDTSADYVRRTLTKFEADPIDFPEQMLCIRDTGIGFRAFSVTSPTWVVYAGPNQCNDCELAHLLEKEGMFDLAAELKTFQVCIIFSPAPMDVEDMIRKVSERQSAYPVYIDTDGYMHEHNRIPSDPRFRTFLVDRAGYPVFVGNPLSSPKTKDLFLRSLRRIGDKS